MMAPKMLTPKIRGVSVNCPEERNNVKIKMPTIKNTEAKTVNPARVRRLCLTRLATS